MGTNHIPVRSLLERFEAKICREPNSGCWLWAGGINERGYGIIGLGTRQDGVAKAHRVAWQLFCGEIPDGLNVLHKCDTPACCRPDHLYLGTLRDNSRDAVERGRNFVPNNRGERAKWRKLGWAEVKIIRSYEKRRKRGLGKALAQRFGCSRSAIYEIWAGRNWAHKE